MAPSDEGAMRWSKFCNGKKNELPFNFRKSGKHLPTPKTLPVGASHGDTKIKLTHYLYQG